MVGCMTESILFILELPVKHILGGTFFIGRKSRIEHCFSGTGYHFQEFDSGTGCAFRFRAAPPCIIDDCAKDGGEKFFTVMHCVL